MEEVQRPSDAWRVRARRVLAGGVSSHFRGPVPEVLARGQGALVWDADGEQYLDFALSQGPLIHGHCHPAIYEEVHQALGEAQVWNGIHRREVELAEQLCELVPCAERVRFGLTGSEMIHAAVRAARALTGKRRVLKFEGHYHGWLDGVAFSIHPRDDMGREDDPLTVPWCPGISPTIAEDIVVASWNRIDYLERIFERVGDSLAAVITEPIMLNTGCIWPQDQFLERLRGLCDEFGVVLIFDEVITGFRVHPAGAGALLGVRPDLAVFAKALGAGFPVAALVGTATAMAPVESGAAIHAGTLNAFVPGIAAAQASLKLLTENNGLRYQELAKLTDALRDRLAAVAASAGCPVWVSSCPGAVFTGILDHRLGDGPGPRNYREFIRAVDMERTAALAANLRARKVRILGRGLWYVCTEHTPQDIEIAAQAFREALDQLCAGE